MRKSFLALTLAAVIGVGLLTGCGSDTPATETAPAAEEEKDVDEAPQADEEEAGDAEETGEAEKKDSGDKLVLGFAQIGQESGWRDGETNDVQWYAAQHTDTIDLVFADAQQKQENQIKAIRNFIDMGVDVIAFPPVVETGWEAVLTECQEAGIPVILVDRGVDESCADLYATQISSDFVWEGAQAADIVGDLLGGSGKVVELEGTVGASAANERKEGFDKELADNYPDIEIVDSQTGDFTRALGKEVMESFLKSYDDIDAVFAHNDDMALGAIEAIKEAGKKPGEDIKIVGCDGVKGAFEAMVAGEMNGTVECNPCLAEQIFETAAKLKAGETVDKWIVSNDGVFRQEDAEAELPNRTY